MKYKVRFWMTDNYSSLSVESDDGADHWVDALYKVRRDKVLLVLHRENSTFILNPDHITSIEVEEMK